jgi:hypothetical protein
MSENGQVDNDNGAKVGEHVEGRSALPADSCAAALDEDEASRAARPSLPQLAHCSSATRHRETLNQTVPFRPLR